MNFEILRAPDGCFAETDEGWTSLSPKGEGMCWEERGIRVALRGAGSAAGNGLELEVYAPKAALRNIRLHWKHPITGPVLLLSDAWERGYGDLSWQGLQPERVFPWYGFIHDGRKTFGFGVKTGASAMCYWYVDAEGITFTADVTSGPEGVHLGERRLVAATLVQIEADAPMTPFETAKAFCRMMCDQPLMPSFPVYGGNNWYYAYGKCTHEDILADARFMSELAGANENRPFMVIDDGWQLGAGVHGNGGPWIGNLDFPDMASLASEMKQAGVRPGIWCRPLLTNEKVPVRWIRRTTEKGHVLDPSHPGVLEYIRDFIGRIHDWGYELIKHDFSTFDIFGQYGKDMKARVNACPEALFDNTITSAEMVLNLYKTIAEAAKDSLIIGCNTIGHLSAGIFEIQRTGDDTSGRAWVRTRRMGVNTLAFRMPQHGAFFAHDADCAGITPNVPWHLNSRWLELLANSGTPLFVSVSPGEATAEQIAALKQAFAVASQHVDPAVPLDWMYNSCPAKWRLNGKTVTYDWNARGEVPFKSIQTFWWE